MSIAFLDVADVLYLHERQLHTYGGGSGLRELAMLESAVQAPRWAHNYGEEDLFELAAAYHFHLVQNHPFVDGNKRIGAICALVFLELHGLWPEIPDDDFVEMVLTIAQGQMDKPAIASFLREHRTEV